MNELEKELKKLHQTKKVVEQSFPAGNFQEVFDELKAFQEKYNVTPGTFKMMVSLRLKEDAILRILNSD